MLFKQTATSPELYVSVSSRNILAEPCFTGKNIANMNQKKLWNHSLQNPLSLIRLAVLYPFTSAPDMRVCARTCVRACVLI